ncbi:YdbL family protein [Lentisalinibacter salinarum]|uniref:YdbL family protein n=1 Tax=Lentisalinibacter salinarum TaxID=2992239 RepID=UPI00386CCD55
MIRAKTRVMTHPAAWLSLSALLLAACVTINVYFPAAEAERAADRIIDEVRGTGSTDEQDTTSRLPLEALPARFAAAVADFLVPAAHAQGRPDFDASSPAKRALEQSLKQRFPQLKPYYDSGAIGLTARGTIEIRDRSLVPLNERNRVRQLVAEQNADWEALYREIARINGHPEWEDEIRQVFADRWIAKAERGWYYRDAGGQWRQK